MKLHVLVRIAGRFPRQCGQLWPVAEGRVQGLRHDFRFADREVKSLVMLPTVDTEIDDSRMTRPAIGQHAHDQAEGSWPHKQQLLSEPRVFVTHCLSS